jgi:SAM-dependent methyltransferase
MNTDSNWKKKHELYQKQGWINKPSIFAEEVIEYLPKSGTVLCLGEGQGQDGRFFASRGYRVTSTDISESALEINRNKIKEEKTKNITVEKLDLREKFPYKYNSFDIVYAHLAVQYFDTKTTTQIFKEVQRVLKPDGVVAVLVNSVDDPEYNTGKKIENDLFETEGFQKRFFSVNSMKEFSKNFQTMLLDNNGRTYKDEAKGVHNLIRFIGRKI